MEAQISDDITLGSEINAEAKVGAGVQADLLVENSDEATAVYTKVGGNAGAEASVGGNQTVGVGDSTASGGASVSIGPSIGAVFGGGFRITDDRIEFGSEADLDLGIGLSVEGEASLSRDQIESGVEFVTDKASDAVDTSILLAGQASGFASQAGSQVLDLFTGKSEPAAEEKQEISPEMLMSIIFQVQFAPMPEQEKPESPNPIVDFSEATLEAAEDFIEVSADKAKDTGKAILDAGTEAAEETLEFGKDAAEATVAFGKETAETTVEYGTQAVETTIELGTQAAETTVDYGTQAAQTTIEYGTQAMETTVDYGTQAATYTVDKSTEALSFVGNETKKAGEEFLGFIGFGKKKKN